MISSGRGTTGTTTPSPGPSLRTAPSSRRAAAGRYRGRRASPGSRRPCRRDTRRQIHPRPPSQGDTVVTEYTSSGTRTGDVALHAGTVPATGRHATVHACDVYEVKDGKIHECRTYLDTGAIMNQLGLTELVARLGSFGGAGSNPAEDTTQYAADPGFALGKVHPASDFSSGAVRVSGCEWTESRPSETKVPLQISTVPHGLHTGPSMPWGRGAALVMRCPYALLMMG
ncbi:ester cyclase [Streptomyces sp. NPDC059096]|uniref:ester cyclase n=1 Tax=Streptomyces sp. NPDC059096 TaxID=3346727 RepID=UPI00367BE531